MSAAQLGAQVPQYNPIDHVDTLANSGVKAFLIHGDHDQVVPLGQNSAEVVRRYKAVGQGALITLVIAPGQGHNFWPGFFHCQELIDFAIQSARDGARKKRPSARKR